MVIEGQGEGEETEKGGESRQTGCAGVSEVRVMWACWGTGWKGEGESERVARQGWKEPPRPCVVGGGKRKFMHTHESHFCPVCHPQPLSPAQPTAAGLGITGVLLRFFIEFQTTRFSGGSYIHV